MGFLKDLFSKKEEAPEEKEIEQEEFIEPTKEEPLVCEGCGEPITQEQIDNGCLTTKIQKKFHKQCFRKIKKEAKYNVFQGN